jgi:hypothetical protein
MLDTTYLRLRDNADRVAKLMRYVKGLLTLNENELNQIHDIQESGITRVPVSHRPSINDPEPSQTYPDEPSGSPIREQVRHVKIQEG